MLFGCIPSDARAQVQKIFRLRNEAERFYETQQFGLAKQQYRAALRLSTKYRHYELATNLLVDLGSMEHLDGQYKAASELCLRGLTLLEKVAQSADSTWFKVYSSLGEHYRQREYVDSSAYYFDKADYLLSTNSSLSNQIPEYVIYHFSNQSMLHELVGRFTLSQTLALKALRLARQQRLTADIAIVCTVVAGQYERLGKYREAMQFRLEGLANYSSEDLQRARMYSGIGRNALYQNKLRQAIHFLHRAERLYTKLQQHKSFQKDLKKVIALYNHLGRCYLAHQEYRKADAYFDKAITLHRAVYGSQGRLLADSWLMKGKLSELRGQPVQALKDWKQALAVVTHLSTSMDRWGNPDPAHVLDEKKVVEILLAKGALLRRLHAWGPSLHALQRGVHIFQLARRQLYLLEDKLYLSETIQPLHRMALDAAYQCYRSNRTQAAFDTAFSLLEQGRATAIQDFMAESVLRPQYIPEAHIRHEQQIRQQLSAVRTQLLDNPNVSQRGVMLASEQELRHQHYQLLRHWEQLYPAYNEARYVNKPVTTPKIQASLPATAAYLSFGFAHGQLHLFAVTRETTSWKVLAVDSTRLFGTLLALQHALARHPGLKKYQGTPFALQAYEWFIRPLLPVISYKKEWIVNAGLLDGIPVEVLETGKTVNDYLARHYTIRYVYSAALLSTDSTSYQTFPPILAIAPFTDDIRPALKKRFGYRTLKATREEMVAIDATRLLGQAATRRAFLNAHQQFSIWYFSTHAYLDKTEYTQSYIALYPDDTTHSHRLYADEISQMNLRNLKMVILSACKSGHGKLYQSEGLMSLARAFGYAGCPLTINTLWDAHDRSSAFLMKHFLRYLHQGQTPAHSLHLARQDYFNAKESIPYNHPYFWANFVVIGSDVPLSSGAQISFEQVQILLGIFLILIVCFVLVRWRYSHLFR